MANFKNAADEKAYEEDYEMRAEQHRKEEKKYRDNGVDDSLFKKLHYKVRVAGFGSAAATVRAVAGYAGQTDVKKLQDWMDCETVDMAFRAFHDIEKNKFEPNIINKAYLSLMDVFEALGLPQNRELLQKDNVKVTDEEFFAATAQPDIQTLIAKLPENAINKAVAAVNCKKGISTSEKTRQKNEISYAAMAILVVRFFQVLRLSSDGKFFFPGIRGLPGNFSFKVCEAQFEIEDVSRACEMYKLWKAKKAKKQDPRARKHPSSLAQKPYFYSSSVIEAREPAILAGGARRDEAGAHINKQLHTTNPLDHPEKDRLHDRAQGESMEHLEASGQPTSVEKPSLTSKFKTVQDVLREQQADALRKQHEDTLREQQRNDALREQQEENERKQREEAQRKQQEETLRKQQEETKRKQQEEAVRQKKLESDSARERLNTLNEKREEALRSAQAILDEQNKAQIELDLLKREIDVIESKDNNKRKITEPEQDGNTVKKQKQALQTESDVNKR